ncbi:MAG: hypothetical protein ABSF90_29390 [Syntrophobacteraceae bacterium]|jgi:hypothetical protein
MSISLSRKFHNKKYMWDGMNYENGDKAAEAAEAYRKDGFEVEQVVEEDRYLVYTRRVVAVQSAG